MTDQPTPDGIVHLRTDDVSVLIDLREGRLPAIVHWGAAIGDLDEQLAAGLSDANVPLIGPNTVDEPIRLAILPEHHTGYIGRPGISGSRDGAAWSPKLVTTSATVDGADIGSFHQSGPGVLTVESVDQAQQLAVTLTLELLPSGLLRTRAALRNDGDRYTLDDLVIAYPVPAQATELLDLAGRWGRERVPQRSPFVVGTHLRQGRKGRTGADAATVLHAGTAGFDFAGGDVWAVHTAWSGNHTHYAELTFDEHRVIGGGELLLPGEVRLESGESYESPWVYGSFGVGLDAVAHRFHRYLRSREHHVDADRPITLNVWEAVYFDHDADRLIDLAERAAAIGVERYVLDDGWFGSRRDDHSGLGDWVVSKDVWPDGLHPLVNRVRELGMQFGLWFEPEMVNPDSDLAREHPDWIMSAREEWPVLSRFQQVANLSIPECYAQIRDQISALVAEYAIDYIKWDHNRDLIEAGNQQSGGTPAVHAQTQAVYRLMGELKAAHPGLEIESCSSGGARVDLGILEQTDRVWVSDCIDPLERQQMLRWTSQLLAPELMGSHIASGRSHTTNRNHDLNFRAATAVFGHLGIEWDLADASERALSELRAWLDFYKQHRGLLLGGDLVRMDEPGDGVFVHGVVAPDRSAAIMAFVLVSFPLADPAPRLRFRGLDPQRRYRIRPCLVGAAPAGFVAPPWFGAEPEPVDPAHPYPALQEAASYPGMVITGAALEAVGVQPPRMSPDQVTLFTIEAEHE